MSNDPLPSKIDIRKLTVKGSEISSNFSPAVLKRLASLLANKEGGIAAELSFYVDEGRKRRVDGHVKAQLNVVCQRCLEAVSINVESDFKLAIVWTDDQAKQLPKTLEPIIVGEELVDLADIVEEELILSLPVVSYHNDENCQKKKLTFGGSQDTPKEEGKENPFKVLEQLRSGNKQ